jgi:hypothetical protein
MAETFQALVDQGRAITEEAVTRHCIQLMQAEHRLSKRPSLSWLQLGYTMYMFAILALQSGLSSSRRNGPIAKTGWTVKQFSVLVGKAQLSSPAFRCGLCLSGPKNSLSPGAFGGEVI